MPTQTVEGDFQGQAFAAKITLTPVDAAKVGTNGVGATKSSALQRKHEGVG